MALEAVSFDEMSAVPEIKKADTLHQAYKLKLINSFVQLLTYVGEVLHEDYSNIINRFRYLEQALPRFFSPRIYALYFELLAALREDNILNVKKIILHLEDAEAIQTFEQRKIQRGLCEDWERHFFAEEARHAFDSEEIIASLLTEANFDLFKIVIENALNMILKADPVFFTEIHSFVATIQLVHSDVNINATSPKLFGAVYLSLLQGVSDDYKMLVLADQLVHETSHLYLHAMIAHDSLVLNDPQERFSSPFRSDLRPMLGIYHAAFVLSRVIRVFKKILEHNLYQNKILLNEYIATLIVKYESAYNTVITKALLTEAGRKILVTTRDCALIL